MLTMGTPLPPPDLLAHFRPPFFPGSLFLSFEGIEGAGKSTQIVALRDFVEERGFRAIVLREPGSTPLGEKIRRAILDSSSDILPLAEAYLFGASRAQLLRDVVLKELAHPGTVVICDRFLDSTLAYQGLARGLGMTEVLNIHIPPPLNTLPHRTFYLRITVETSRRRQSLRRTPPDYFESKGEGFLGKIIEGLETAAQLFPERIVTVEGEDDPEAISHNIFSHLEEMLPSPSGHNAHNALS